MLSIFNRSTSKKSKKRVVSKGKPVKAPIRLPPPQIISNDKIEKISLLNTLIDTISDKIINVAENIVVPEKNPPTSEESKDAVAPASSPSIYPALSNNISNCPGYPSLSILNTSTSEITTENNFRTYNPKEPSTTTTTTTNDTATIRYPNLDVTEPQCKIQASAELTNLNDQNRVIFYPNMGMNEPQSNLQTFTQQLSNDKAPVVFYPNIGMPEPKLNLSIMQKQDLQAASLADMIQRMSRLENTISDQSAKISDLQNTIQQQNDRLDSLENASTNCKCKSQKNKSHKSVQKPATIVGESTPNNGRKIETSITALEYASFVKSDGSLQHDKLKTVVLEQYKKEWTTVTALRCKLDILTVRITNKKKEYIYVSTKCSGCELRIDFSIKDAPHISLPAYRLDIKSRDGCFHVPK